VCVPTASTHTHLGTYHALIPGNIISRTDARTLQSTVVDISMSSRFYDRRPSPAHNLLFVKTDVDLVLGLPYFGGLALTVLFHVEQAIATGVRAD
jgi:hypothetical protein